MAAQPVVSVNVPVLKQCHEVAVSHMSELKKQHELEYSFQDFSYVPASHSDLLGVLEISSDSYSVPELVSLVDGFMVYCNPSSSTTVPLASFEQRALPDYVAQLRKRGAKGKIYIDLEDGPVNLPISGSRSRKIEVEKV